MEKPFLPDRARLARSFWAFAAQRFTIMRDIIAKRGEALKLKRWKQPGSMREEAESGLATAVRARKNAI